MKTESIETKNGVLKIEYFDSIEELPIERYNKFNKYLLIDSALGSDAINVVDNLQKAIQYLNKSDIENGRKIVMNVIKGIELVNNNINVGTLCFSALVTKINDVPIDDLSDTGIIETANKLGGINVDLLNGLTQAVQKKNKL